MKMSDVFELPVTAYTSRVKLNVGFSVSCLNIECAHGRDCDGEKHAHSAAHAINNHDRLTEENKQQRESLDAFRELVKAQTKTIHDLNEESTALQRENADLKDKTLKLTTTMYQLRDYLSDIEYDLDQADSVFTLKDEIALIDETLTIRKE
ncbi:putative coil containing protein [Vibrio phage 191E37-1]|nr:putative coil containing protein [Vibrio phage 191E37-1]